MQQAQVVIYGIEGVLAERLRERAEAKRFWLRETSQHDACRNLLLTSPTILVVMLGRDLERELALVDEAHTCVPETAIIAVGESDNPVLAGLAWDLGASYVLFPPTPNEVLVEVIERFLTAGAT